MQLFGKKKKKLRPVGSCVSMIFQLIQQFHVPLWILLYCIYCLVQTIEVMARMLMLFTQYCTLVIDWKSQFKPVHGQVSGRPHPVHRSGVRKTKNYILTVHYLKIYHEFGFSSCFRHRRLCWTSLRGKKKYLDSTLCWRVCCVHSFHFISTLFIFIRGTHLLLPGSYWLCGSNEDYGAVVPIFGGLSSDS